MTRLNRNWVSKGSILILCALSLGSIASEGCSNLSGCERKFCEMESQIEQARHSNNQDRIDGLTTALEAAKSSCTDADLKRELVDEIRESEDDLAEYMSDLSEARSSGKAGKVEKYQKKIREEKIELERLSKELSEIE